MKLNNILETILNEGTTKNIIDKWSNYVAFEEKGPMKNQKGWSYIIDLIQDLTKSPLGTKYVNYILTTLVNDWIINVVYDEDAEVDQKADFIVDLLYDFEQLSKKNLIDNKDIYSTKYKNIDFLSKTVKDAKEKEKEKSNLKKITQDADKIYSDDRWLVIVPKSHEASCHYGAGTKWCTTMKNLPSHYENYSEMGPLFYIIDKTRTEGVLYKLAIHLQYSQTYNYIPDSNISYITKEPELNSMTGYDELDDTVNLKYVLPLLPKNLINSIYSYYENYRIRFNKENESIAWKKFKQLKSKEKITQDRLKELEDTLIDYISDTHDENPDSIYELFDEFLDQTNVEHLSKTWGSWAFDINKEKFQIFPSDDYPNQFVEEQYGYFIDGKLFPKDGILLSMGLYKLNDEDSSYGSVEESTLLGGKRVDITISMLFNSKLKSNFYSECLRMIDKLYEADDLSEITPEDWEHNFIVREVIDNTRILQVILEEIESVIGQVANHLMKKYSVPSKTGDVIWSPKNSTSTYLFNYPPTENSLTYKFVNYVKNNPGITINDFYSDVLNKERKPGNNSMFFGSILDSGIITSKNNRYYIGHNYDNWTKGKLKRV